MRVHGNFPGSAVVAIPAVSEMPGANADIAQAGSHGNFRTHIESDSTIAAQVCFKPNGAYADA
jgi:hypothetical protein